MTTPSYPELDYWYILRLQFKSIEDSSLKYLWVTNRVDLSNDAADTIYWPILTGLSELGIELDSEMPKQWSGSFELDNTIGSFGAHRKIGDLLERYICQEQDVVVYIQNLPIGSLGPDTPATTQWHGKIVSPQAAIELDASTLSFEIRLDNIPDTSCALQITTDLYPDAPESSIGKYLPLAVGSYNYLPAYKVSETGSLTTWVFATNLDTTFKALASSSGHFLRSIDGDWVEINHVTNITPIAAGADRFDLDEAEELFEIPDPGANVAVTNVYLSMDAGSAGTSACQLKVSIYQIDATTLEPIKVIASGSRNLIDYDAQNDVGSDFYATVQMDKTSVLDFDNYIYALGIAGTGYAAFDASVKESSSAAYKHWTRTDGYKWNYDGASNRTACAGLVALGFLASDGSAISKEGFAAAELSTSVYSASADIDYPADGFESLNILVKCRGLRDDTSATITGSVSSDLSRPDWLFQAITSDWDGEDRTLSTQWDTYTLADEYDESYASSGRRTRRLLGFVDGNRTLFDAIETVCKDSASRIGITNDGKLFVWPWGIHYDTTATIPPYKILPISWEELDATDVVNRVSFAWGKSMYDLNIERNIGGKQLANYSGTLDWSVDTSEAIAALIGTSEDLFGLRQLEDLETSFVGDERSAETLGESYLVRHKLPGQYATFVVPFEYSTLTVLDKIRFAHPLFPAFNGAWSDDAEAVVSGSDCARTNVRAGHIGYRALYYNGLIEGRTILPALRGAPLIRLVVYVLRNYPGDPT